MTPADRILQKVLVASSIPSSEWERIRVGLRDRAFFSSRIESAKFLSDARAAVADLLSGAKTGRGTITTREDAIKAIRESAERLGLEKTGSGALTDPKSRARAAAIVDTNAGLAAGYVRHEKNMTIASRLAFPAQEFIRVRPSSQPRPDWPQRWIKAGGKIFSGRMVALVESEVWTNLSRFGVPYPPFDYGSGMGVRMVSREDAISIGLIAPDYTPEAAPRQPGFNANLEVEFASGRDWQDEWKALKDTFGDQIRKDGSTVKWRHELIREAFTGRKPFVIRLGEPTSNLLVKLPPSIPADRLLGKKLVITQDWLDNKRNKRRFGDTDHRHHFYPLENDDRNIPLTVDDIELIPSIWRNPDAVSLGVPDKRDSSDNRILLELSALDGGIYKMVVDFKDQCRLITFFKNKAPASQ